MFNLAFKSTVNTLTASLRNLKLNGCSLNVPGLDAGAIGGVGIRSIGTTPILFAEPLKKKKRLDPAIVRAREQRKQRKLEKAIRRLQKHARQLKPLDELQIPMAIQDNPKARYRKLPQLPTEEVEQRWMLEREMINYRFKQYSREIQYWDRLERSQEKALEELKQESEDLYNAAITIDHSLLPYKAVGPTETPPIENFVPPEGDYIDISRNWEKNSDIMTSSSTFKSKPKKKKKD